jgi:nicotinamidase-related amidase
MPHKVDLFVVDPQNDFCDPNGALSVPGADGDMERLAAMLTRLGPKLNDIHVTLDSHRIVDISHPIWWRDSAGNMPPPFTLISVADMEAGTWTTKQPGAYKRTLQYLKDLEAAKRYPHCIWPPHCLIGDWGHAIVPALAKSLHHWEETEYAQVDFVTKGSNPWTEHFSGVQAEVPDPDDPTTQLNSRLITLLEEVDMIVIAGEARSHCLANTVRDVANNFSDPKYIEKMVLLTDATSDVGTFESLGADFMQEMTGRGMKTATTIDFLS